MKRLKYWAALLVIAGILMQPEAAVQSAQRAMRLWTSSVAPSLFPFLVLMPVLTGPDACAAYEAAFSRIMRRIFGLPGAAAPAVVIGMISGSPGGAIAVRRIAAQTGMNRSQACRIALAVGGASPAYLVLGVGQGLFGSARLGMLLALMQVCIQLLLLQLLRDSCDDLTGRVPALPQQENGNAFRMAVENILVVCGYMVFFSSISGAAAGFLGKDIGTLLLLAADMPSGLSALMESALPGRMFLLGMAIGFSGICICVQNLDVLRDAGMTPGRYFAVRCIAASLMGCACLTILNHRGAIPENDMQSPGTTYAFSFLTAIIIAIPVLIYFSKNFFLNKRNREPQQG